MPASASNFLELHEKGTRFIRLAGKSPLRGIHWRNHPATKSQIAQHSGDLGVYLGASRLGCIDIDAGNYREISALADRFAFPYAIETKPNGRAHLIFYYHAEHNSRRFAFGSASGHLLAGHAYVRPYSAAALQRLFTQPRQEAPPAFIAALLASRPIAAPPAYQTPAQKQLNRDAYQLAMRNQSLAPVRAIAAEQGIDTERIYDTTLRAARAAEDTIAVSRLLAETYTDDLQQQRVLAVALSVGKQSGRYYISQPHTGEQAAMHRHTVRKYQDQLEAANILKRHRNRIMARHPHTGFETRVRDYSLPPDFRQRIKALYTSTLFCQARERSDQPCTAFSPLLLPLPLPNPLQSSRGPPVSPPFASQPDQKIT